MSEKRRLLIAYDGSEQADAAIDDLQRAGLPQEVEAVVISIADVWHPPEAAPGEEIIEPAMVSVTVKKARQRAAQAFASASELGRRAGDRIQSSFQNWQ